MPGQLIVAADNAVKRHGANDGKFGHRLDTKQLNEAPQQYQTEIGALIAGWDW
jgi:hypothetical protein